MTGFCSSPRYLLHDTGPHHPERPDRIRAIYRALIAAGMLDIADPFPGFELDLPPLPQAREKLMLLEPRMATEDLLELVHPRKMIDRVKRVCAAGGGTLDQGDTPVGQQSFEIALLSLGGVLTCVDAVLAGQVRNAFAAVRPPGHHAEPERSMGFCIFSNLAIAARYLQRRHGIGRLAIVDFDVHHANGTQAVFEGDPNVFVVSFHQHPKTLYPGSGYEWETGTGEGMGTTLNVPFTPGADDADYMRVLDHRVIPRLDQFRPEFVLVSAGFDAHRDDPLAQIELTDEGFGRITRLLVQLADEHCGGRLVSVLEGGYNLSAMGRSVVRHRRAMQGS